MKRLLLILVMAFVVFNLSAQETHNAITLNNRAINPITPNDGDRLCWSVVYNQWTNCPLPEYVIQGRVYYFTHSLQTFGAFSLPLTAATSLSVTNSGTVATITRAAGSFITDGWQTNMQVEAVGFVNSANFGPSGGGGFQIVTVAALTLTLQSMAAVGCASCIPAVAAMIVEGPTANVSLYTFREGLSNAPAVANEYDETDLIANGDGAVAFDEYFLPFASVPGQNGVSIPAGQWVFNDWWAINSVAGNPLTIAYQVLQVSPAGVETTLFTTPAVAITALSIATPQNVNILYSNPLPIPLVLGNTIITRPLISNGNVGTAKIVSHAIQGLLHQGYVVSPLTNVLATYFTTWTTNGPSATIGIAVGTTLHTICGGLVISFPGVVAGHIVTAVQTGDGGGAARSDFGLYNSSGVLVADYGAQVMNTTGTINLPIVQGITYFAPGNYYACYTSTTTTFNMFTTAGQPTFYAQADAGFTTTGGQLNNPIVVPANQNSIAAAHSYPGFVLLP